MADVNMFTTPFQLTKSMYRDVYLALNPSNPALSAKGKVVVITGAGGGLGFAIARAWAQAGAAGIALIGRTAETLHFTIDNVFMINQSILIIAEPTDVPKESIVKSLLAKVKANFGKAHVLLNSAATMALDMIGDIPVGSWWGDYSFGSEGTIINLVSLAAAVRVPGSTFHSSSKLAVVNIGRNLSHEYSDLRVSSVHPGIIAADDRGAVVGAFTPIAKDTQALTGGVSLWLHTPKADFLKGGYLSVSWDVNEMEAHADEIKKGKLN